MPKRHRVEVLPLGAVARAGIARRHPAVAGYAEAFVIGVDADVADDVRHALARLVEAVNGDGLEVDALVDELVVLPDVARGLLEDRHHQADLRTRVLRDHPQPDSVDPAALGALADAAAVFSVPAGGVDHFLGFQFDAGGRPLPVIAEVLEALAGWAPWDVAAWFVTPNGLLRHAQPVALLAKRPGAVAAAARRDGAYDGRRRAGSYSARLT